METFQVDVSGMNLDVLSQSIRSDKTLFGRWQHVDHDAGFADPDIFQLAKNMGQAKIHAFGQDREIVVADGFRQLSADVFRDRKTFYQLGPGRFSNHKIKGQDAAGQRM